MKFVSYSLKFLVGLGLLYILFSDSSYVSTSSLTLFLNPARVAAVVFFIWTTQIVVSARYFLLLKTVVPAVRFWNIFLVTSVGQFLAQTFLGSIASDATRLSLLKKTPGLTLPTLAGTMILDRAIALYGMILVCGAGLALALHNSLIISNYAIQLIVLPIALLISGGLSMFVFLASIRFGAVQRFVTQHIVPKIQHEGIVGFLRAIKAISHTPKLIDMGVLLSVAAQAVPILAFSYLMGDELLVPLTVEQVILALPLALLANMVPITPAGIGVGEAAFEGLLKAFASIPPGYGAIVFLQYRVMSILAALPGLIALAMFSHGEKR